MSERNPNYVTPEEAETMKCQMSFNAVATDDEHYLCLGPKCMAWRWESGWQYDEKRARNTYYSTTHGYCGVVPL